MKDIIKKIDRISELEEKLEEKKFNLKMKTNWLIEKHIFPQYEDKLVSTLKQLNSNVFLYDESLNKSLESILKQFDENDIVISHTSIQDARRILKTKVFPGTILTIDNYECYKYYGHYGHYMLNNDYILMGMNDVLRNKSYIFNHFNSDNIFIRPSNGFKSFAGQIISKNNFDEDFYILNQSYGGIDNSTLTLLSSSKEITEEYRFIIINNKVISGSLYMDQYNSSSFKPYYNKICQNKEVIEFAQQMANIYAPDSAFTLDICRIKNNELKVMEINSCLCASWYGADLKKIVNEINTIAINLWKDIFQFPEINQKDSRQNIIIEFYNHDWEKNLKQKIENQNGIKR